MPDNAKKVTIMHRCSSCNCGTCTIERADRFEISVSVDEFVFQIILDGMGMPRNIARSMEKGL
jgi:hypothetical protein